MPGQEETQLIRAKEFSTLPPLIRKMIPGMFGTRLTAHDLFIPGNTERLREKVMTEINAGLTAPKLEALSFSEWLYRPTLIWEEWAHRPPSAWHEALNPAYAERGAGLGDDCIGISDRVIDRVSHSAVGNRLLTAQRVTFYRPGDYPKDEGGVQNMAFFTVGGTKPNHFLVDTAAFFYNPVWSKAWQGHSIKALFEKARLWLSQGEGKGQWEDAYPDYANDLESRGRVSR